MSTDPADRTGHPQYAAPGQPATPPANGKPPRNTVGLVALVTAIVGFVFALWEGAYIIGWILLPIAFVLSLVGLFQRDRSKRAAIVALIISIVGTVAGGIAFAGSIGRAFESAAGGPVTAAAPAPVQGGQTEAPPAEQPAGDSSAQGTRDNPYPLGGTIANNDWELTVNSFTADATQAVLAENQFNDEPAPGHQYALANVTVARLAEEAASPLFEVTVEYVTAQGNVVGSSDAMVVAPDAISPNELYKGASTTGNVALQVPEGDDGLLRVRLGFLGGDDIFFATS
ncbi:MAG TPA: hypothetical protein GXZ45_12705 [Propionibacterium sp.]|nr:hypothetical protein [Propionibacterium sp.]